MTSRRGRVCDLREFPTPSSEALVARRFEFFDLARRIDGLTRGASGCVDARQHGFDYGIDRRCNAGRRIVRACRPDQCRHFGFAQCGRQLEHVALKHGFVGLGMVPVMRRDPGKPAGALGISLAIPM
jgi:hypothetical protein